MRRRKLLARGGIAAMLVALMLSTVQSSRADEWYPSLPDTTFGTWSNASQGGLSYAKRAKQWFRSPTGMTVAEFTIDQDPDDLLTQWVRAEGYFVSPKGAPANYGYLEPMTVRSVGFGLMPVEATVQVSQRRENGYPVPVPVRLELRHEFLPRPPGSSNPFQIQNTTYKETVISDRFNVQILNVKVDGVDLELNGNCRTVEPAPVTMRSPEYYIEDVRRTDEYMDEWFRSHDPSTYYHPIKGGQLTGTMTIPPFTGCTTAAGDDLSGLLTLSASGPDNPVMARTGWPCGFKVGGANAPAAPGVSNPKIGTDAGGLHGNTDEPGCPGPKPFEYPERPND